jgi:hypothetical protein
VAKVGTSKAGGTISQQAAVHPWLAVDAHGNKQQIFDCSLVTLTVVRMTTVKLTKRYTRRGIKTKGKKKWIYSTWTGYKTLMAEIRRGALPLRRKHISYSKKGRLILCHENSETEHL